MAWERDQKNLRRIGPWVAIKTHWSGGSLCFGKSINHGLPEARRVQLGKDHAIPPPWVSSFRISSWLHQQTGYWLTRLLAVMLLRSQLHSFCLGHVSTYSPWIKKKINKAKEGEETTPALHTVSRQPGSCFIFFRVDFVLQVAGSHEPQK